MNFADVERFINFVNSEILFSSTTVYILLATGILFTLMSGFGQYRALTHGVAVVRGKYDETGDPGAISHFQALSAALSATVGLGNIGGVAAAVALGGPGAVFWMWVIGVVGMALKMTEVTQSMLYRNTDDPENPHGGPMFVVKRGFAKMGHPLLGGVFGGFFCVTLILSAITGGNMFQSWNVAAVTSQYTPIEGPYIGAFLAIVVGLVIIGGIKRIGKVAGVLVPFMCGIYVLAALAVLFVNIADIPAMLGLIVSYGLGLEQQAPPVGAFLGGSFGAAFIFGVQRALFSSEAGQGSAPIAHSAVKTDEPVREGVVAGLEPFIDTIVVCTMTALVILSTGAWDREPEAPFADPPEFGNVVVTVAPDAAGQPAPVQGVLLDETADSLTILVTGAQTEPVRVVDKADVDPQLLNDALADEIERIEAINIQREEAGAAPVPTDGLRQDRYVLVPDRWMPVSAELPDRTKDATDVSGDWRAGQGVFVLVDKPRGQPDADPRVNATVRLTEQGDPFLSWTTVDRVTRPRVIDSAERPAGIYGSYVGAQLTAHAFDRAFPGVRLGNYLVLLAAWLFAISTMISWSYYGEQGIVFLFGDKRPIILVYKLMYCVLVFVSSLPFIETEEELNMWTTLGLGAMLIANIPIMLLFGLQAMTSYHSYIARLKSGELDAENTPKT